MFLVSAKRMTRGMARLRHWLIMAMRMLAVAGLIFAVARPLASGWLGLVAGGRPETLLILLDRSASMEQQDLPVTVSKRATGLAKLAGLATTLGASTRVVLIDSADQTPRDIDSPELLAELPAVQSTSATADIPGMLREAADYVRDNNSGRTDIWICSDLRQGDWDPESGRWQSIRQSFSQMQGVRFHLLHYASPARDNISVWVAGVKRRRLESGAALVFDLQLRRDATVTEAQQVPVGFVINGARTVLDVEMTDQEFTLQGHVIPIDDKTESGWGRIELPADANPQDNVFYFVFGPRPEHRTVVVADDPQAGDAMRLAARTPVDPGVRHVAEVVPVERIESIDWDSTALILWQTELPAPPIADRLEQFVQSGRTVVFFPPEQPGSRQVFGVNWSDWQSSETVPVPIADWREDTGLLANTLSGDALPVGDLKTFRHCRIEGDQNILARFEGGDPLLAQASTDNGAVYFCSTLPRASHSSFARDGVVFYVMVQRALTQGAASLGKIRQLTAGTDVDLDGWETRSTSNPDVVPSSRRFHAGVYAVDDQLLALNRPAREDRLEIVGDPRVAELFAGLDYYVVKDRLGSAAALASEIWKTFLVIMGLALLFEAALCIPPRRQEQLAIE